ncbi:MAG: sulfurtransferase [Chloroflexi bacterium]|nr:sulfurtransferase [Chloroflexota bacterium]
MPATFARPELLASPDWLAENLSRPGVRIVDCRWRVDGTARKRFATAHIPGAVFLDWAADLIDSRDPQPFQLAGPEGFTAALSAAGIGDGMTAVLYDDTASLYACRVWWSFQVYGLESVRILDGGWLAWQTSGRPSSYAQPTPEAVPFTPRADPRRRLSTTDVKALLGSPEVVLLDVRAPAEYAGQEGTARRLGHIPGAVNVPAALLTDPADQRFRDAERLGRLFQRAGVARDRRVVTYDTTGIAAAKTAFALTLLGYRDVAVYDAGWTEWGSRMELPLER